MRSFLIVGLALLVARLQQRQAAAPAYDANA